MCSFRVRDGAEGICEEHSEVDTAEGGINVAPRLDWCARAQRRHRCPLGMRGNDRLPHIAHPSHCLRINDPYQPNVYCSVYYRFAKSQQVFTFLVSDLSINFRSRWFIYLGTITTTAFSSVIPVGHPSGTCQNAERHADFYRNITLAIMGSFSVRESFLFAHHRCN